LAKLGRPSKSQINRLGDRLRAGEQTEEVLKELDDYRSLFVELAHGLIPRIEIVTGPLSARVGKTTPSVVAKLRRQHTRLSQMQDIAGARVVVDGRAQQDGLTSKLVAAFPRAKVDDKRAESGYRAVHIIFMEDDLPFELQIRTNGQHSWAQVSEEVATLVGPEVKYGGGPETIRRMLLLLSEANGELEELELLLGIAGEGFVEEGLEQKFMAKLKRSKDLVREVDSMLRGAREGGT